MRLGWKINFLVPLFLYWGKCQNTDTLTQGFILAGITLAQAEEQLSDALNLLKAIRTSQEYVKADLSMKRALLRDASSDVDKWDVKVRDLSSSDGSGKIKSRQVTVHA